MAVVIGAAMALAPVGVLAGKPPPQPPPPSPPPSSGNATPSHITVSTSSGLSYSSSSAPSGPAPQGSSPAPSCSGPGWRDYSLTVTGINRSVLSGVNVHVVPGVGLVGGSPSGNTIDYASSSNFTSLPTYPRQVSPSQNWFVAWEGSWQPQTRTIRFPISGWVATQTYRVAAGQPAGTATTKWVDVGRIQAGRFNFTRWQEYQWEQTGTGTRTVRYGCSLQNLVAKYYFPEHYCVSAACVVPHLPPNFASEAKSIYDTLTKQYSGGRVASAPPPQTITVWVPTFFSLQGNTLPSQAGETYTGNPVSVSLPDGRSLQVTLEITLSSLYTVWTYSASGAQSGKGFTCSVETPPGVSDGGQNLSDCTSPNVGHPSSTGSGYTFTHDANSLTVTAVTYIGVGAVAVWTVNGVTYSYAIPLNLTVVGVPSSPEHASIQQVEGVTVPGVPG